MEIGRNEFVGLGSAVFAYVQQLFNNFIVVTSIT